MLFWTQVNLFKNLNHVLNKKNTDTLINEVCTATV